jgi:predicted phosphodiesterase
MPYKKVIAIPDIQAPKHDDRAIKTAEEILRGEKPDIVILVGDVIDLQSVSRFPPLDWNEAGTTAADEIKSANFILDLLDAAIPKKTVKIYLEGNHDRRLELWFIQHGPKLGRDFKGNSVKSQLELDRRGYEYVTIKAQPYKIGKVGFVHGWFVNKYHANKTVSDSGQNLIYGHTHDYQVYTGKHLDQEAPRIAMSVGCLCDFRQSYLEGRPMNWIHGVGIVYVDEATGRFWPYFAPIIDGVSVIAGKTYAA